MIQLHFYKKKQFPKASNFWFQEKYFSYCSNNDFETLNLNKSSLINSKVGWPARECLKVYISDLPGNGSYCTSYSCSPAPPSYLRHQTESDELSQSRRNTKILYIRFSIFFDASYVIYPLSKIYDDIQVVSQFPCLLRHPVLKGLTEKKVVYY